MSDLVGNPEDRFSHAAHKIRQAVLEKMFKIVDDVRRTYAGAWVYYELTYEPSAQVS